MLDPCDLSDKIAVITGASSGLGEQFAQILARKGAKVAIIARRMDKLQNVEHEINTTGGVAMSYQCDVSDENQVANTFKAIIECYGKIDILINNAGISGTGPTENYSLDDWNKVIGINLTGVFLCSKYAAQNMISNKYGKIVNIASIAGVVGFEGFATAAYSASKGGVINMTRALANEWGKHNITVNAIAPGFFPSEMTQNFVHDENMLAYIKSMTALDRWGMDGELNGALLFLASDASSYTTGQTICVDGGWTSH